jgi:Spy/CpxP family protein refolding chaperone
LFNINIIFSLLPRPVIVLLAIGKALLTGNSNEWVESFELTEGQVEQLKAIENDYEDSTTKLETEVNEGELLLNKLIISRGSAEELKQKEHELEVLKLKAMQVYFEKFLAIREVLTPAQVLKQCEIFALTPEERMEKFIREQPNRE